MTSWQPDDRPRRAAAQTPTAPPQWGQTGQQRDPRADSADGYSGVYPGQQPPASRPRYGGQPGSQRYTPQPQPRFQPTRQTMAPTRQRPQPRPAPHPAARYRPAPVTPATRRRPPYPAHLVRFPAKALGLSRRRRGPSLMHVVYLGTHPVALLMSMAASMLMIAMMASVAVFVIGAWVMWWCAVTCYWGCQVAVAALRR